MRASALGLLLLAASTASAPVAGADDAASAAGVVVDADAIDAGAFAGRVLAGPRALAIDAATDRAAADVDAAGLWANPGLRLERQSGPLSDQTRGSQDFAILELPLSPGGHRGLQRQAASERFDAARLDARLQRAGLAREAHEVFIDVVIARRRLRALQAERTEFDDVVAVARRQATAGEAPASRALRLELELARLDDDIAAATTTLDLMRQRAAALVDGPLPDFVDALPSPPSSSSASSAGAPPSSARVEALTQRAVAASTDEAAAGRRAVPEVVVGAGPSLLQTGSPDMGVGYLVSVEVGLPFFDRGQGDAARARAERAAWRAEAAVETRRLEVARRAALARRDSAVARSAAFSVALERARALKAAATSDLVVGSGDVIVYVDTMRALRAAGQHLLSLQDDAARADVELALVHGAFDGPSERP